MKHTHVRMSFGQRIVKECNSPGCPVTQVPEPRKYSYTPAGAVPNTPEDLKDWEKYADETKKLNRAKFRKRPKPAKPLQVARHRRVGPFGTDQATCLDSRLD